MGSGPMTFDGARRGAAFSMAVAFVAAWAVAGAAEAQIGSDVERAWNRPVVPFRVAGNVYYVGAHEVAAWLVATPDGHVVIDSGFEETVPQIVANIETLGFRPADVKVILNSHAHYDHCGGLATLRERTGAKIAMTAADAGLAARGGKGDPHFGDRFAYRAFTPDRVLADGDVVEIGGSRLVAHVTPGHTRGCTTWTLRVEDAGHPLDVAFLCSVSAPGYRLLDNPGHPSIVDDYRATFRRLEAMPVDVFLANHAGFFDLHGKRARLAAGAESNPFLDRDGWKRHLAAQRQAFEAKLAGELAVRKPAGTSR